MRISDAQVRTVIEAYRRARATAPEAPPAQAAPAPPQVPGAAGDRVEVSAEARESARYAQALARLPEVREEVVAELRRAIADGSYRPAPEQVADKIAGRSLVDRLA